MVGPPASNDPLDIRANGHAGALDVSALRIAFKVTRTLKWEPNTAEFKIWNLSPDSRLFLETPKKLVAQLDAGYESGTSQIYLGEVRAAETATEGPDLVTTISTGDGLKEIQKARINVSFGPKTPADVVLRAIAKTLGINDGNIDHAVSVLQSKGVGAFFSAGGVMTGQTRSELTAFCRSAGLEWSIQNGKLQILDLNKALEGKAIEMSSSTGLVGSPSVDSKGIASAVCLMIPEMRPGVLVNFNAKHLKGGYRVIHCEYVGDTHGQEWQIHFHAKKY